LINLKLLRAGGDKKIFDEKLNFKEKAKSKCGSTENIDHVPGGGDKKIFNQPVVYKSSKKVAISK
jgi:hypothetical protein